MKKQKRLKAVQRFYEGEEPNEICASLGCSRSWLYKWASRFAPDDQHGLMIDRGDHYPAPIAHLLRLRRL